MSIALFYKRYFKGKSIVYIGKRVIRLLIFYFINYIRLFNNKLNKRRTVNISYVSWNLQDLIFNLNNSADILLDNFLQHRFDILGSGWINVDKGINLNSNYNFINWHCDFKSGYEWDKKKWYKFISYGFKEGVDIKVPWELGRLQHLPFLAICFSYLTDLGKKNKIQAEFEMIVQDFIDNNQVGYGVNWSCTMDVSIRVANMVLAYEIFLSKGVCFEEKFKSKFIQSLYFHGRHIFNNLECEGEVTNNHYLSNICGLLFVSSVLRNNEADNWFEFANRELITEFEKQFYLDGVNFESSTSYHRLSTEMVVYSCALILGYTNEQKARIKNHDQLPVWFIERVFKALTFLNLIMKSNFEIPQVGDNDSGRFFKLSYVGDCISKDEAKEKYLNLFNSELDASVYFDENILDHRSLGIALNSLFGEKLDYDSPVENAVLRALTKGKIFEKPKLLFSELINNKNLFNHYVTNRNSLISKEYIYYFSKKNSIDLDDVKIYQFLDSGFILLKGKRFYLLINACPNGQNGIGGHSHNDKLSFELEIDGETIFADPGTYLYTPNPELRNMFRSTLAHNTILIEGNEQNSWKDGVSGLFSLKNETICTIVFVDKNELIFKVQYRDIIHYRHFFITNEHLRIVDFCNKDFIQNFNNFEFYSNGYGRLIKRK